MQSDQLAQKNSYSVVSDRPIVAVFDFDGTLTNKDSFLPFIKFTHGNFYWLNLIKHCVILIGYLLDIIGNHRIKEVLTSEFFTGWLSSELESVANNYAIQEIPKMLNPLAIERLRWHQSQGHKIILVSANLEIYLKPWAEMMGIDIVLATQLTYEEGKFTGKIQGQSCYGEEKLKRLQSCLGTLNQYCLYVYGDSRGDKEILSVAEYSYYRAFSNGRALLIK